jgi:hypothetical protein
LVISTQLLRSPAVTGLFTWSVGRRDHFLLMSCLGIRGVSINTFIASRRWRDHVLVLGWRKGLLLFPE